ncbi:MAG: VWA domain-containing protein [Pyrinomonadaceae bacterium]|nr:VWA domain-containing protein [Pyrinomonadaceae bacterium]
MSFRRPVLFAAILVASFVRFAAAQEPSPKPAPSPTPPEDGQVVKITTAVIQLDVAITDRSGRPVTDIRPEEIEIYENGVRQQLTGFSFVSNPQPKLTKQKKDPSASLIPEPPLVLRPENVRRTIALVVDDLTLSFASVAQTRAALRRFVEQQMQDGDLVGIIRTGAGIGALQQFTSDKRQLMAAIERVRWNPKGVGKFGSFDPIEPTMLERVRRTDSADAPSVDEEDLIQERDFQRGGSDFRESVFTAGTLGALKYIVSGMAELPGRKSVMMFSDGLRIFDRKEGGSIAASRTMEFLKRLIDEANRKSVIFYPLDARGLEYTGLTAADQVYDPNTQNDPIQQNLSDRISDRSTELFDTQQGLRYLAEKTGGFAYINQNNLSIGVNKVLEDQSFYLVAYEPDGDNFNPELRKFNDIEVKVKREGVEVRHRSGFFTGDVKDEKLLVDVNFPTKLMRALTSPFAINDISVSLNALFGHTEKRGYFVHSFLHIDAGDLEFTKLANGDYQANFEILAIAYGDNGAPVEKNNATGSTTIKPEHFERVKREGFAYSFIFPFKKPGAYQMRVALIDRASKAVGSANQFVEVPNLKKTGVTLGGIVLENVSREYWDAMNSGSTNVRTAANRLMEFPDPKASTAFRRFRRGSVLRFGVEALNAAAREGTSNLTIESRVFHDRKLVFTTNTRSLASTVDPASGLLSYTDAVELGKNLLPGDYVLQIVVSDPSAKKSRRIATQYVQFEVLE